jgi:hypothetical protein
MQKKSSQFQPISKQPAVPSATSVQGGLLVRTNLRAGLALDDLDDQALSLWNKLTSAVSNAAQTISNNIQGSAS